MPTTTPVQFEPEAWQATLNRYLSYQPQRMYFTHYSMAENVPALAERLRAGIQRYCAIGLQLAAVNDRHAALKAALMKDALDDLALWQSPVLPDKARELLANDIELNAQGLGIWLDNREKAA
jgi:hypothetical protein